MAVVAAVTGHGVATVAVAQAAPLEAVDPMAVAVPTAIAEVRTAAGPAAADRTAVVAAVAVRARCTLPLAAPVETRPVCHSCHAETVRCIAVIASAVSVTAGPPGNHTTLCFSSVIVSAGLVRRSRTLSPETAVRPRRHAGFRPVPARGVRT
ncbi:MAG: hypothetical protein RL022_62 [Chloroflexota bacterium]